MPAVAKASPPLTLVPRRRRCCRHPPVNLPPRAETRRAHARRSTRGPRPWRGTGGCSTRSPGGRTCNKGWPKRSNRPVELVDLLGDVVTETMERRFSMFGVVCVFVCVSFRSARFGLVRLVSCRTSQGFQGPGEATWRPETTTRYVVRLGSCDMHTRTCKCARAARAQLASEIKQMGDYGEFTT